MTQKSQLESTPAIDAFVRRWQGHEGGQERANYGLFLVELCDALGLERPDPANAGGEGNDYVFERAVRKTDRGGGVSYPRIDLYKRGCFILEAKQSRMKGARNEILGQLALPVVPSAGQGRRGADRAWDVLMVNARQQAEAYVPLLPLGHEPPPFLIVCDVGHCFEVYANFRRDGKVYDQFPDRRSFRVYLDELRDPEMRARFKAIWQDPSSLDPARAAARVSRAIAERLAAVSKVLETAGYLADDVAMFLMRCLFTMFAADVGLLPRHAFRTALERCEADPARFVPMVEQLWAAMDGGGYAHAIEGHVRRFNGAFFKRRQVLPLGREEIGELRRAASHDWRDVDPSIFGTLLEQALEPGERRRLGAHYTPRAYVERLVVATVIEPLQADWLTAFSTAERQKAEGRAAEARRTVTAFHDRLCATRVLDPACGTGNFLYVALELMKRLEGEVLEVLVALGGQEALTGLEGHTVDPHQFLGLEINPRAAAIAELVLWIGHLQCHLRTRGGLPNDPILKDFRNIEARDAILVADAVPPSRAAWPAADFIVGNPPFTGGKDLRARLGEPYATALWAAHPQMNESADLVMYWWDHAAGLLTRPGTALRRFGFVTTNSVSQVFQRRVVQRHLAADRPVSIVMAVPDHPWTKVSRDAAAVRIAMTVCAAGRVDGVLRTVVREAGLDTDAPVIAFDDREGRIHADLTTGTDITATRALRAGQGLCSPGMKLHGAGFIVSSEAARHLGLGRRDGLEAHVRPYRNGRDLAARSRGALVIDLFGLAIDEVRQRFPEVYQHLLLTVAPEHLLNNRAGYRDNWWTFGEPRRELRPALAGIDRYIATIETAKHRVFQFLDRAILPDNMLVVIAARDAVVLGVLSSRPHRLWAALSGGTLEDRPRYSKSRTFDPFPFPACDDARARRIAAVAEDLDAHRKAVLDEHPHLTLTGLYNVLERLRAGARPADLAPAERRTFDDGLVLILRELHDSLDGAVAEAYGWPAGLDDDALLSRLVALNGERAAEEARGRVRWLRPDYQAPRLGRPDDGAALAGGDEGAGGEAAARGPKPSYPAEDAAQTAVVMAALMRASGALDAAGIATRFKQGRRVAPKVAAVLLSLYRMGLVATVDGGGSFVLQRFG